MTNEYGVSCLLTKESADNLLNFFPFLDKENQPHISLFQFHCEDAKFICLLKSYIKNISVSTRFLTTGIRLIENNIFMDISDDSTLKRASNEIADFYFTHHKHKTPLSQINLSKLTAAQCDLVKKYGIYWIKKHFTPHVTLLYEIERQQNISLKIPEAISIHPINIYRIDSLGRINKPTEI